MTLKERIYNELVVSYEDPDPDRLVSAVEGIVGITPGTYEVRPLWRFDELTGGHKTIAYLLAAWAASEIGDATGAVPEDELVALDGVDESVLGGLNDEWIERQHGSVRLRHTSIVDAVDRLLDEYHDPEKDE